METSETSREWRNGQSKEEEEREEEEEEENAGESEGRWRERFSEKEDW